MSNTLLAWHFLKSDRLTANNENIYVTPGLRLQYKKTIALCIQGYHASENIRDALRYAPSNIVCRVKLHGTIITGEDKAVASCRTVLWMADATRAIQEYALWCGEQALDFLRSSGLKPDPRSENALLVMRLWLDNKASDQDMNAVNAASYAVNAASYAANTASYAVNAASYAAQNDKLTELISALEFSKYAIYE